MRQLLDLLALRLRQRLGQPVDVAQALASRSTVRLAARKLFHSL
jgi:hypothetical protein